MTNVARTNESVWQYLAKFCIWTASANILKTRNKGPCIQIAEDDPSSKKQTKKDNTLLHCYSETSEFLVCCVYEIPQYYHDQGGQQYLERVSILLEFPFISMTVAQLPQGVCHLCSWELSSAASFWARHLRYKCHVTNHFAATGKLCHKALIGWYQNKCTYKTNTITL